jgi:predicted esterase
MKHTVSFPFTGRYHTAGNKETAQEIWFVLHGYGQLAQFFIRKFSILTERKIFLIAPEALSRFYLEDVTKRAQGGSSRVGASWMTREERLTDITNYLNFLDAIYKEELANVSRPITILGFSQGAATASRWVTSGSILFNRLIIWGGIFPPDLDFTASKDILKDKDTFFVIGKDDPFMQEERSDEMKQLSEKLGIQPRIIQYPGKHDIDEEGLQEIIKVLF